MGDAVHQNNTTLGVSVSNPGAIKDVPEATWRPSKGKGFAAWFTSPERALTLGSKLSHDREALAMQATLRASGYWGPLGRRALCERRASAVQNELDVAGILAPCV